MTIAEARETLADDAVVLTDKEIQEIIDWLNMMADITLEIIDKEEAKNKIALNYQTK